MSPLKLCSRDPLLTALREIFDATPLRLPEERVRTLCAVGSRGKRTAFLGSVEDLLLNADGDPLQLDPLESSVASLSDRRSNKIDLSLGLDILQGFLPALGIPVPSVEATLRQASSVVFSFADITRRYVEVTRLGKALAGRMLDPANPATTMFSEQRQELLVIDSVLTSNSFTVDVDVEGAVGVSLDLGQFQTLAGDLPAGVSVATTSGRNLVFTGPTRLTFAFSCVRLFIDDDGQLASIEPSEGPRTMAFGDAGAIVQTPNRVLLTDASELLEWSAA